MPNRTNPDLNKKIGKMLQSAREANRITQHEMSKAIDITTGHISAIERGQNKAPIAMLLGYCEKMQLTPNDVLGYTSDGIIPELDQIIRRMDQSDQKKLYKIAKTLMGN